MTEPRSYRPALVLAIVFLTGQILAMRAVTSPVFWMSTALVAGLGLLLRRRRRGSIESPRDARRDRPIAASRSLGPRRFAASAGAMPSLILLLFVASVGGSVQAAQRHLVPRDSIAGWVDDTARPLRFRAVVERADPPVEVPAIDGEPSVHDEAAAGIPSSSVTSRSSRTVWVRVQELAIGEGWGKVSGRLELRGVETLRIAVGERVEIAGRCRRPPSAGNPREFCRRRWLARYGLFATCEVRSIETLAPSPSTPATWIAQLRDRSRQVLIDGIDGRAGGLAIALGVGLRADLDPQIASTFRNTGIGHVLAISGLHVGLLGSSILTLAGWCGWRGARGGVLATIVILLYALMAGAGPSVVRAVLLAAVAGWGWLRGRGSGGVQGLSCAAIALAVWDPAAIDDLGAQLSFLGVAALMVAAGDRNEPRWAPVLRRYQAERSALGRVVGGAIVKTIRLQWATTFVMLATAPLVAHHFRLFAWGGWFLNTLIGPPIALALLGMVALLSLPWPIFCRPLIGWPVCVALDVVIVAAETVERWVPPLSVAGPGAVELAIGYGGLAVLVGMLKGDPRRRALVWLVGWVGFGMLLPETDAMPRGIAKREFEVRFVDVGHGNATILRWPSGEVWLIDAGSAAGDRSAVERIDGVLADLGARRIDRLWLSHPDRDHYGAAIGLAERFPIGVVHVPAAHRANPDSRWRQTLAALETRGIPIEPVERGDRIEPRGSTRRPDGASVLYPPRIAPPGLDDNGTSLVLLIEAGGGRLLLPGDLEGEAAPAVRSEVGSVDLLVAPHHGSPGSDPLGWIERTRPFLVVVSGSKRHPWMDAVDPRREEGTETIRNGLRTGGIDPKWRRNGRSPRRSVRIESTAEGGCLAVTWPEVLGRSDRGDTTSRDERRSPVRGTLRAWRRGNQPEPLEFGAFRTASGRSGQPGETMAPIDKFVQSTDLSALASDFGNRGGTEPKRSDNGNGTIAPVVDRIDRRLGPEGLRLDDGGWRNREASQRRRGVAEWFGTARRLTRQTIAPVRSVPALRLDARKPDHDDPIDHRTPRLAGRSHLAVALREVGDRLGDGLGSFGTVAGRRARADPARLALRCRGTRHRPRARPRSGRDRTGVAAGRESRGGRRRRSLRPTVRSSDRQPVVQARRSSRLDPQGGVHSRRPLADHCRQ